MTIPTPDIRTRTAAISASILLALAVNANAGSTPVTVDPATRSADKPAALEIAFVTHLDMNLPEQDVFIEREPGSGSVYRVTTGDNDMRAPLYRAAASIPHDPFDPNAIGPHKKGEPLNMSLGQWLKHQGRGTYECKDGEGNLEVSFSGLVPNGTYTLWYAFMAMPPTEPFTGSLDLPLGARDGSESIFQADAQGVAAVERSFKPCLEMSNEWVTAMLAVNWHSDGKTYAADPGEFGLNAHIPLFVMLPNREGIH